MNSAKVETVKSEIGKAATVFGLETPDAASEAKYRVNIGGETLYADTVKMYGADVTVPNGETVALTAKDHAELVATVRIHIEPEDPPDEEVVYITQAEVAAP